MKKKILMLGNAYQSIFTHRRELVEALRSEGHEVVVSFTDGFMGNGEEICAQYGCKFIDIPISRRNTRIHEDLMLLMRYYRLIRDEKPDAVLAYTVKCDVYGGIAAAWNNVPFMPNITGLGKGLAETGIVQKILIQLYRFAVKKAKVVFFQSEHDRDFFIEHKIAFPRCVVLPGSGVNLSKYKPLDYPEGKPAIFLFNSRIMKPKGIDEFLEAARVIRARYPDVEFHVCGYCEKYGMGKDNYRSVIAREEVRDNIIYHDFVSDMNDYYKSAWCVVLPSYHPEGVANVLLEAAACARPIITTDHPGCRETVDDGVSGYLVGVRDSADLIAKIENFLALTYEQRKEMGLKGRAKIEREFDRQRVIDAYMNEINAL
ncbi:MAG: glycosyltransferase family 4 protein [Synergistaceae bacterium]|nr:glycosyltransferase family 4 protein [Synergistaceae bacterium]